MKKLIVFITAALVFTVSACNRDNSGNSSNQSETPRVYKGYAEGNPVYSSMNRIGEDGVENDQIYTFSDGIFNPDEDRPIIMLNGTFNSNAKDFTDYKTTLVSLRELITAFGGEASHDEETAVFTFTLNDDSITAAIGENFIMGENDYVGSYYFIKEFTVNGKDISIANYGFEKGEVFVSLDFITFYLNLDNGYLPGRNMPYRISYNPFIWVDYPGSSHREERARGETLDRLKQTLLDDLNELSKKKLSDLLGTDYIGSDDSFASVIPKIMEGAQHIRFFGMAGRYALYICPDCMPTVVVDMDTGAVYYYYSGNLFDGIAEYPGDEYGFFTAYIFG